MADIQAGKPLITLLKIGSGSGPATTPITIDGALVSLAGNVQNGVPIDVNLVDSSGNPVPNGPISQVGNVFNAEIIDVTTVSVNAAPQGSVDNWQNIEIDVDDKNGNPITPTITKVGNTINLDIAGVTPISVNTVPQGNVDNWDNIEIDVDDKNGNPITPAITKVGNTINLDIAGNTPFQVNGGASPGVVPNWDLFDIRLRDQFGGVIAPTSVSVVGSIITINENVPPAGSGIAFQIAQGTQYTSYANFDEGWRMQNGWFDYVPPLAPLKRAYLDYTQGANSFYVLGEALTVAGISSTTRFVSITGNQVFTGGTNRDKVLIDKLTGLMMYRVYDQGTAIWTAALNNADAFSVTVDGVTYNDWYLISAAEAMAMFGNFRGNVWNDPVTGIGLTVSWPIGYNHTATTYAEITTQATSYRTHSANGGGMYSNAKTNSYPQIFIRKCRNLIS